MSSEALRAAILAAEDVGTDVVDVPEWGVKLELRSMTGQERARMLARAQDDQGNLDTEKFYPQVLIATCFDPETGERIFADSDADAVNQKSAGVLERLAQAALNLSGMGTASVEKLGNVSAPTPSGASTSV